MPLPDICNGCDKIVKIVDYRGLCDSCAEKEDSKEYYTNCCEANFVHPGWPDNDMCSKCFEHADIGLIIGGKNV